MGERGTGLHPAERYLWLLVDGDAEQLVALFGGGEPIVDDPRFGRRAGRMDVRGLVEEWRAWLGGAAPAIERVRTTHAGMRTCAESVMRVRLGERDIELPVAVIAAYSQSPERTGDPAPPPPQLEAIRVYHSTWPITGDHLVRPPTVGCEPYIELHDVCARYQLALANGDLDGIMRCFEADGCAREPAGGEWRHCGPKELHDFYASLFSYGGGLPLTHCTCTDDGTACALEYVVTRWGARDIPPQAGCAVYERGASGLLREARIYDDASPES